MFCFVIEPNMSVICYFVHHGPAHWFGNKELWTLYLQSWRRYCPEFNTHMEVLIYNPQITRCYHTKCRIHWCSCMTSNIYTSIHFLHQFPKHTLKVKSFPQLSEIVSTLTQHQHASQYGLSSGAQDNSSYPYFDSGAHDKCCYHHLIQHQHHVDHNIDFGSQVLVLS